VKGSMTLTIMPMANPDSEEANQKKCLKIKELDECLRLLVPAQSRMCHLICMGKNPKYSRVGAVTNS
jgi:hypothetical protein